MALEWVRREQLERGKGSGDQPVVLVPIELWERHFAPDGTSYDLDLM